jgi:hypothetical protein
MHRLVTVLALTLSILAPESAFAGPSEDASAVIDRWATAYSANDAEVLEKIYAPNGILLETTSPVISEGTEGVRDYFKDLPGSGRKNMTEERRIIVLNAAARQ